MTATLKVLSGHEERAMRKRFEGLKSYPTGSFGKAYAAFIEINQFDFPGTPGEVVPPVFRHDCCHITCDLMKDIDPWTHFADPLEDVRERFSIPARGRAPEYP